MRISVLGVCVIPYSCLRASMCPSAICGMHLNSTECWCANNKASHTHTHTHIRKQIYHIAKMRQRRSGCYSLLWWKWSENTMKMHGDDSTTLHALNAKWCHDVPQYHMRFRWKMTCEKQRIFFLMLLPQNHHTHFSLFGRCDCWEKLALTYVGGLWCVCVWFTYGVFVTIYTIYMEGYGVYMQKPRAVPSSPIAYCIDSTDLALCKTTPPLFFHVASCGFFTKQWP